MIRLEPPLDGLDGIMDCGMDQRHVEKSVTAGTLGGDQLHRHIIPIRHGVGMGWGCRGQTDKDQKTRKTALFHGPSLRRSTNSYIRVGARGIYLNNVN